MLEELELYAYDKYIKGKIVEENGVKKISKENLDELKLTPQEKKFIMYILNKRRIEVIGERSPYVRDNNYGDIQANDLQKMDKPVMSKIEYTSVNEKNFEDYEKLDEYLETRLIPNYAILKQRKNAKGEKERFPSIRLQHIMALKLSEAELEHVMNYLKEKNIRVGGKGSTLDGEFDNYDYITTYKESALPLSVPSSVTLQKIKLYKQNKDQELRDEIISDNMRLVPFVAYKYAMSTGIDQHELESYGYEALMLALENFDVSYGFTFATYAISYIRGLILNGISENINGKKDNFYYDYTNAINAVEIENGVSLKDAPELINDVIDLLVATGKIKDDYKAREYAKRRIVFMGIGNASLNDEEMVEELIDDGQLVDAHDYAYEALNKVTRSMIDQVLDTLSEREEKVIRLRFGLDDGIPKTLEEVGEEFNVDRERIRQIEAKALRKLRHPSRAKKLMYPEDDFETERFSRH